MKKFFVILFTTMLCAGFSGCIDSEGSNNNKNKVDKIIGTWNNYKDTWDNGLETEYYNNNMYGVRFREDGSGYWTYYGEVDEYFDWEIRGSRLYFDYDYDDYEVADIKTLRNDELVLSWDDEKEGEYLEHYERIR